MLTSVGVRSGLGFAGGLAVMVGDVVLGNNCLSSSSVGESLSSSSFGSSLLECSTVVVSV